jgi:ATP/maltotriose-dependent transcriptional regulator MalT
MNARCLRARLLLALGKADRAVEHTSVCFHGLPDNAMTGEYMGTRALALAAVGRSNDALTAAREALGCSRAVEVQVLATAARAIALMTANSDTQSHCTELLELAESLGTWDGVVCAVRAAPPLVLGLARATTNRAFLARLLTHSRDFDLAHLAGLTKKRPQAKRGPLSGRETDVILLLSQGLRTREIAGALYIAPSTVKVHIRHIFEKLDVHTRAEAVARYAEASE